MAHSIDINRFEDQEWDDSLDRCRFEGVYMMDFVDDSEFIYASSEPEAIEYAKERKANSLHLCLDIDFDSEDAIDRPNLLE